MKLKKNKAKEEIFLATTPQDIALYVAGLTAYINSKDEEDLSIDDTKAIAGEIEYWKPHLELLSRLKI